jgi:hypothetical protein
MKKMFFAVVAGTVLCAAGVIGFKVFEDANSSSQSNLLKLNLEALSQQEYAVGTKLACFKTISCAGDGALVYLPYCGPCEDDLMNLAWDPSFCTVQ